MSGNTTDEFDKRLDENQRRILEDLGSPAAIQAYLDQTAYSAEEANRCTLRVMNDKQAHCLDGGLFAAAALRRLGYPPVIVDMLPEPGMDDDHVLALFRENDCYGAVAKSNFSGLRYREPVYRTLRELVLSYFEFYFNRHGQKTLRAYTRPINLARFDHLNWMWDDAGVDQIERYLYSRKGIPLFNEKTAARLSPVDPLTYRAGMLGVNEAGLYQPK